nr:hypothetical protein Hi04_10k_c5801_00020 [uncultured bacterium]
MKRILQTKLVIIATLLLGCVTINVYFPAAAAEKAADRIIDDVYGKQQPAPSGNPAPAPEKPNSGTQGRLEREAMSLLVSAADMLITPANAAEPDLDISSPAVKSLQDSLKSRHTSLEPYYDSGAIGDTNDGMVGIHDQGLIPLADRNNVKKMVADQNTDRTALYKEIATANGHPEWAGDIQKTFAERWASKAKPGWFYQDKSGNWVKK